MECSIFRVEMILGQRSTRHASSQQREARAATLTRRECIHSPNLFARYLLFSPPRYCDMCTVKRGLKKVPLSLKKSVDRCVLCPATTGAFKPLHDNTGWCHATCAVWIPETGFHDPATMASVIGIDSVEKSRWRLVCDLCHVRQGACMQCMAHACRYSFHPLCGAAARGPGADQITMEMEAVNVGNSFDVLKLAYCPRHKYLSHDELEKKILIKKW